MDQGYLPCRTRLIHYHNKFHLRSGKEKYSPVPVKIPKPESSISTKVILSNVILDWSGTKKRYRNDGASLELIVFHSPRNLLCPLYSIPDTIGQVVNQEMI